MKESQALEGHSRGQLVKSSQSFVFYSLPAQSYTYFFK